MRRRPPYSLSILGVCLLAVLGLALGIAQSNSSRTPTVAAELPALLSSAWLNSPPLTLAALQGRPVLIEFWTFDCSNCRNTLP